MKHIISIFIAILSTAAIATAQNYRIGDLITNPDGSQGIVFYVNKDRTNGWMVALDDLSTHNWGNTNEIAQIPNIDNPNDLLKDEDGYTYTGIIRDINSNYPNAYGAGQVDYDNGWYIPTAGQLMKLCSVLDKVNTRLAQAGGSYLLKQSYFSCSESDTPSKVWTVNFGSNSHDWGGQFETHGKNETAYFRAVRDIVFSAPAPPAPTVFPDNVIPIDCFRPIEGNPWNIRLLMSNTQKQVSSYSPIVTGDINGDGITDIVVAEYAGNNYRSNRILVYNGNNLSIQHNFSVPDTIYLSNGPYAIGRYPLDNGEMQGAIFTHSYDNKIRSYSIDGTLLNVSDYATSCYGMVSMADFNHDGHPEIYAGNAVFDAATLKLLCVGPENGNKGLSYRGTPSYSNGTYHHTYYAMSYAYNVIGDDNLELICGNTIYNVDIVSRTNPSLNSITLNKTITPPTGFSQDGHVSIADFDLDGECEVLVMRDNTNDQIVDDIYFYAYKPSNGNIIFQKKHNCASSSYVFIGNIDTEPHPEIVFLENQPNGSQEKIFCWRYTPQSGISTIWSQYHSDRSGQTAMTLFDFNQDEIMELIYRDNQNLRIINASGKSHITGNDTITPYNIFSRMMSAGTGCEYPVVADINNDGHAEIIVTGELDQTNTYDIGYGGIHIFGSDSWASARQVWNQYMYNVTNVNNDLTAPDFTFNNATTFEGTNGVIRRPFNNFLQQATYINQHGEPFNPGGAIEKDIYVSRCTEFTYNGVSYSETGTYEQYIENPAGCDTSLTIHLTIGGTVYHTISASACDEYEWNGITYTEPGSYQQSFITADGCDSIVTLNLSFDGIIEMTHEFTSCDSFTYHGETYEQSGVYSQLVPGSAGCDTLATLRLHIITTPHGTIEGPIQVYAATDLVTGLYGYHLDLQSQPHTSVTWLIDNEQWFLYPDGDNCQVYVTTPYSATLTAIVEYKGCISECTLTINATYFDVEEQEEIFVSIYPNPANGSINIAGEGIEEVRIYNLLGQNVLSRQGDGCNNVQISTSDLDAAIYLMEISTQRGKTVKRVAIIK